jgi:hypothetical protein
MFDLIVILAILAILLGLLLPAIQKVRQAAARTETSNHLHQLGIGINAYADIYSGALPPGVDDNHFSIAAYLLPFIERANEHGKIDFDKTIDDPANAEVRKVEIDTYLSPLDPIRRVKDEWGATNFLWNDQLFYLNSKTRIPFLFNAKGTRNTALAALALKGDGQMKALNVQREYVLLDKDALKGIKGDAGVKEWTDGKHIAGDRCASWMDGRFLQGSMNVRLALDDPRPDVSCQGAGGVSALRTLDGVSLILLADESTRVITTKMSHKTLLWAFDPKSEQKEPNDW